MVATFQVIGRKKDDISITAHQIRESLNSLKKRKTYEVELNCRLLTYAWDAIRKTCYMTIQAQDHVSLSRFTSIIFPDSLLLDFEIVPIIMLEEFVEAFKKEAVKKRSASNKAQETEGKTTH